MVLSTAIFADVAHKMLLHEVLSQRDITPDRMVPLLHRTGGEIQIQINIGTKFRLQPLCQFPPVLFSTYVRANNDQLNDTIMFYK